MGKDRGNLGVLPSTAAGIELSAYKELEQLYRDNPIPPNEQLANLGLFLSRAALGRILFMHELYQKIINTHGIVMDFGTRWGQNMALFMEFRNLYEPYNHSRRVVGFDTFAGFPSVCEDDGESKIGDYSVSDGYWCYLHDILHTHNCLAPRGHISHYDIIKGDVCETITGYLNAHPETMVALAYFDMDLYEPTERCLEILEPYFVKGSVIGFDELGLAEFPGETIAYFDSPWIWKYKLQRSPTSSYSSYVVVE